VQVINVVPPDTAFIWSATNYNSTLVGHEQLGALGTVIGGPSVDSTGTLWYDFQFDDGVTGWDSQGYFAPVNQPTPTPTPTPTATPSPTPTPPADTTPPVVSITAPASGGTVPVRTRVTIQATATDNLGVTQVQFLVNGNLICTDTTAPYSCSWGVGWRTGRTYRIQAVATDAAGNIGRSTIISVTSR
jgi:hypothetical protein